MPVLMLFSYFDTFNLVPSVKIIPFEIENLKYRSLLLLIQLNWDPEHEISH